MHRAGAKGKASENGKCREFGGEGGSRGLDFMVTWSNIVRRYFSVFNIFDGPVSVKMGPVSRWGQLVETSSWAIVKLQSGGGVDSHRL